MDYVASIDFNLHYENIGSDFLLVHGHLLPPPSFSFLVGTSFVSLIVMMKILEVCPSQELSCGLLIHVVGILYHLSLSYSSSYPPTSFYDKKASDSIILKQMN